MRKSLFSLGILFSGLLAFGQYSGQPASNLSSGGAQTGSAGQIALLDGSLSEFNEKRIKTYNADNFRGSPYTSNTFKKTTLYSDDESLGNIFYRYNAYNEEVEIKKTLLEDEKIKSLQKDKSLKVLVDGHKMGFKTFITEKKRTKNGYLMELIDGEKFDLYKRILVKFSEGKPAQNSFVKAVPSKFSHFTEYYIQEKGVNRIDEIPLNNRKFVNRFDDEQKTLLKAYLKENDLNVKNEDDLVKAFEYLNE